MGDKTEDQDYSKVCRTCLQSNGEMQSLSSLISDNYGTGETQVTYMECLRFCLPVQDEGVEMPQQICNDCASALQVAYWFTKNACKAQELLRTRLKELQEKRRELERQAFAEALKKPKRFRCKICNIKVETKRSLKDHVKLHLDIIVYNCQICAYENHKRNYLIEHYQLVHSIEASPDQLKPRTKKTKSNNSSAFTSTEATATNTFGAVSISNIYNNQENLQNLNLVEVPTHSNQQQQENTCETYMDATHLMPEVFTSTSLPQNSEFIYTTTSDVNNITNSLSLPLEGNTNSTTASLFSQPFGNTLNFNTLDGSEVNVQNDLNVGNEFVVMADGSVQDAMGRGVVILQSSDDGTLALQNGLVLENLIQVPNAETANMMMNQNDIVQMDVDDMIVEEPLNSPEQDVPAPLDEDMIPATIIKKVSCKICTKDFDSQGELKNHMLTHSDIPHFFCDHCTFYTFFKIDLHQHYKSKHNLQPTNKQLQPRNRQKAASGSLGIEGNTKNVVVQRIERLVYYCDICFYECDLKCEIKRHYSTKHKIQATEVHQRASKSIGQLGETFQKQTKTIDARNIQLQAQENGPDYPNGLNCRKCNEVFFWRNELHEHYKLHDAEENALKQQNQINKIKSPMVKSSLPDIKTTIQQQQPQQQQQHQQHQQQQQQPQQQQQQQQQHQQHQQQQQQQQQHIEIEYNETPIDFQQELQQPTTTQLNQTLTEATLEQHVALPPVSTVLSSSHSQYTGAHHENNLITTTTATSLDNSLQTFDNVDTMSLGFGHNQNLHNPAPLTPSSTSTYILPSDAIPQIVEMEQTIETDMDFDFVNGDALFEDFDDVDVENETEDHDEQNTVLTSDDDYEEEQQQKQQQQLAVNMLEHNSATNIVTQSYCAQCKKSFDSHYQFENHMFLHRGLAPYRCEMCINLYNTKRALIRHYKAVHKKVPSRDMIQAKGDKVYIYDKTPMDYINIEESKFVTLMCAKCIYESVDLASVQLHLNTIHDINDDTYILRKLPFECPRCIRSFATKPKLLRHLERNHSTTLINLQTIERNSSYTATTTTTTTTAPSLNNNVNMMQINAECDEEQQKLPKTTTASGNNNAATDTIHNSLADSSIIANIYDGVEEDNANVFNEFLQTVKTDTPNEMHTPEDANIFNELQTDTKLETSNEGHKIENANVFNEFQKTINTEISNEMYKVENTNHFNEFDKVIKPETSNEMHNIEAANTFNEFHKTVNQAITSNEVQKIEDANIFNEFLKIANQETSNEVPENHDANVFNEFHETIKPETCNEMQKSPVTEPVFDPLEFSNTFDSNLIKIEESNIANCDLLKNDNNNDNSKNSSQTIKSVILYRCELCYETCNSIESVMAHGKNSKCNSLIALSKKENPLFECQLCHCKYKTLHLLTIHLKRHIARKYRCSYCTKTYVCQMELDSHQNSHRDERPHKCDKCPNSFRYVHHLKRHKDIIHFGKRHMCPETNCNRQFTTLDQLKMHKWSHYGIVPYKCQYCERFFKKRFLLREHCLKSHNIRLTENEVAEIFRNNLGYSSPHDMTVAVRNGCMLRRDEWESLPHSLQ